MRDTDAAWLAGFLEGEGSFMVTRQTRAGLNYPTLDAAIAATNTDIRLLNRCKEIAGGHIVTVRLNHQNSKWKDAYHWRLHGRAVGPVIEAMLPFLVAKREQAELLHRLRAMTRRGSPPGRFGTQKTPEEFAAREEIWVRVRDLNRRGHPATSVSSNSDT